MLATTDDGEPLESALPPRRRPRIRKLRLLLILTPLGLLAIVSALFGMVMAIASDLQPLENYAQYKTAKNSELTDINGRQIAVLTDANNRLLVTAEQIPPIMKRAIISVEDKRFNTNSGVDIQGIGRAFVQDIFKQRAAQGASTITQQFVKNALAAQNKRTIFEKLREAALAYHLTKRWSKDKILTEYLNAIYFGNGAYGIESAARTYFGHDAKTSNFNCGTPGKPLCVLGLRPWEAALLAGIVASPSAYDPISHAVAALTRRNLVLEDMYKQGYLRSDEFKFAHDQPLPDASTIKSPQEKALDPSVAYFTTWVKQQVVDRYKPTLAFEGGLKVRTTLDLDLQRAAEKAVNGYLAAPGGPSAALVAIDNATGEVRAMVGGRDYNTTPFNLATQGQRQPGSSFKAFVLAQALKEGISPDSVWPSMKRTFVVPNSGGKEHFVVNNFEATYAGSRSLRDATTYSDNSVFAAVGIQADTHKIAKLAQRVGIRTPVSTNPAITLGGLRQGVTPLDMAHAYETFAHGGERVTGTLASPNAGPVGIHSVQLPGRSEPDRNKLILQRILPADLVSTETDMLHSVVISGTAKAADFGQYAAGKTGTTENYSDAWFIGYTKQMTVAVWVGYPTRLRSMKTDFNGGPVEGGTFPALIWHDFMLDATGILQSRAAQSSAHASGQGTSTTGADTTSTPAQSSGQSNSSTPGSGGSGGGRSSRGAGGGSSGGPAPSGSAPTPAGPSPQAAPTPQPATPPSGGGGGGSPGASGGASAPPGGAQAPNG
ncbi:MAG: transglycosylase domain-containing protein [Solirubrobacteraceae bacterium]